MADLLGASIPERGAASTLQELLLRSQPLPRSPLRHYSSSSCSEAAAMAAADSLLTPLESCKNVVRSSWHQVVRRRQASSGQPGHHGLWCGQPPSGAASAASRRPLPRGKRNVWGPEDVTRTEQEIVDRLTIDVERCWWVLAVCGIGSGFVAEAHLRGGLWDCTRYHVEMRALFGGRWCVEL